MSEKVTHVIEVRAVGEDGSTIKKDPHDPTSTDKGDSPAPKKKIQESINKTIALKMGAQAAKYATSNYGAWTGDTIGQQRINETVSVATKIGIASSGPVGFGVVVGDSVITGTNRLIDIGASRVASRSMRERLGITLGGSR